jgi:hypothetical protein
MVMISRRLEKSEWKPLFDLLSKYIVQGKRAEIEIAGLDLGDQVEAEWLPLSGIVYDHKDDIVEVALGDGDNHVDHIIRGPREIYFVEDAGRFISLDILDANGRHQIVKVKDFMMLPPTRAQGNTAS